MGLSLLAHGAAALTAGTIVHLRESAAVAPAPARLASQVALTEIELVPAPTLPLAPVEAGDEGTAAQPEISRPATPARRRSAGPAYTRAQASGPTATLAAPISDNAGTAATPSAPAPAPPPAEGESQPARFALVVGTIGNVAVAAAPSSERGAGPSPAAPGAGRSAAGGDVGPGEGVVPEREVTERAQLVSSGPLVYPAAARRAELEADVALELVVGLDGRVVSARVRQPAGYGLDEEAVRAVGAYRFSPARRDGRPVRVRMPWTVQFRLR